MSTCRVGGLGVCGKSDAPPSVAAAPTGLACVAVGAELGVLAAGLEGVEVAGFIKKSFIKKRLNRSKIPTRAKHELKPCALSLMTDFTPHDNLEQPAPVKHIERDFATS
jgi:hypothetical protein